MIKQILSVDKSKDGTRTFATDELGNPMFGRTPAITAALTAGAWVNVVSQLQTKTRDTNGNLVDLEPHEQRNLEIITAVFPTEDEAIRLSASPELFVAKKAAYVKQQTMKIAETYKVEGSLAGAI